MFAAAGIVVTETSTPISAPDFAEVSESTPATPARKATMNENASGFEMKSVSGCASATKPDRRQVGAVDREREQERRE